MLVNLHKSRIHYHSTRFSFENSLEHSSSASLLTVPRTRLSVLLNRLRIDCIQPDDVVTFCSASGFGRLIARSSELKSSSSI
ncbi:hypothetical protein BJV82DRAFT_618788 [Fennellomyces sp. T-0311]|nr:hypothetical protein BJV82DRAFT_618788 [Fennellomyces sp. T-0311]